MKKKRTVGVNKKLRSVFIERSLDDWIVDRQMAFLSLRLTFRSVIVFSF